ncbi:MAG TPA: helix-hairpin-helix domain-containing protein [Candidatus Sulfotelmatobacter sp.]|nr:helix-hairpin-helix domain-containing protein [Candidatus Sulfotelmatobacter sp.]
MNDTINLETLRRKASVLVALLWIVALLSVVVVSAMHTTWMDLVLVKSYGDRVQAHYLALAGIERAEALLYKDAQDRSRSDVNHHSAMYDDSQDFKNSSFGRGEFTIFRRGRQDEGGGIIYGVSDEESRLNVNVASSNELMQLPDMTLDVASSIIDWRSPTNVVMPGGAEAPYYESLQPPYEPRNASYQTVRELLMVKGVTPQLLLGDDIHQDGFLPAAPIVGDDFADTGNRASDVDSGWAGLLTVDSYVNNVDATGQRRVNIQTADQAALSAVPGITPDIAQAIISYRGQHQFQSIADLLDVTAPQQGNQGQGAGNSSGSDNSTQSQSGQSGDQSSSGQTVISDDLLMDIGDEVTAESRRNQTGLININTASLDVLACLPGVDRQLAQAIISYRQSSGFFPNIAWLLKVPGMTEDIFKQVAPLVSARSETYRIVCEGRVTSTGARQRIQVIVHIGLKDVTLLSWREDDL